MAGSILLARWPDWRERLEALGEWAALGFYEGADLPWPRAYGLAYRRLYEKTAIAIREGALLALGIGTPVLNIRFQKRFLAEPAGLEACRNLVMTFFELGGAQIQVSVLDTGEMRAAQQEPEKRGDLIVRIGGYSEYFTKLSPALQESVIARTEYG